MSRAEFWVGTRGLDSPHKFSLSPANLLTEAHSPQATRACSRLANQALAGVTDVEVVAGLPQPPRTHLATATAIWYQGHSWWASGWWPGAGAWCLTQLG